MAHGANHTDDADGADDDSDDTGNAVDEDADDEGNYL